MQQLFAEIPELVEMTAIYGDDRKKLTEAILTISVEGLMPAFESLKRIRASVGQVVPELNRRQIYEAFTIEIWRAYKDLAQTAAKLLEPEMGFLFQKTDSQFEVGLAKWGEKRPQIVAGTAPYLRRQRATWQNDLSAFRNYLEHKNDADPAIYAKRYEPAHAEALFDSVWRAIADILMLLVSLRLSAGFSLAEIPPEDRNQMRPNRFRLFRPGIPLTP